MPEGGEDGDNLDEEDVEKLEKEIDEVMRNQSKGQDNNGIVNISKRTG